VAHANQPGCRPGMQPFGILYPDVQLFHIISIKLLLINNFFELIPTSS
jgi:hypothetical protein